MTPKLKLRAVDAADLEIVSAAAQDALVAVRDCGWLAPERRFAMVVNRFRWEESAPPDGPYSRTHAALVFDEVYAVRRQGIPANEPDRILDLLAIALEPGPAGTSVLLRFAADRAIRLDVARLSCRLEDLGEPWPTLYRPGHPGV